MSKEEDCRVKSLQQLCVQKILGLPIFDSVDECWNLYTCGAIDLHNPHAKTLKEKIVYKLTVGFPYLLQKYGEAEIKSKLDESAWNFLWKTYLEEKESKERFAYLKGTVLERREVKVELSDFYPLEALQSDVVWPSNVDVTKREQYLNDDDFFKVFGMTKASFKALPQFKRVQLKKEKNLF